MRDASQNGLLWPWRGLQQAGTERATLPGGAIGKPDPSGFRRIHHIGESFINFITQAPTRGQAAADKNEWPIWDMVPSHQALSRLKSTRLSFFSPSLTFPTVHELNLWIDQVQTLLLEWECHHKYKHLNHVSTQKIKFFWIQCINYLLNLFILTKFFNRNHHKHYKKVMHNTAHFEQSIY